MKYLLCKESQRRVTILRSAESHKKASVELRLLCEGRARTGRPRHGAGSRRRRTYTARSLFRLLGQLSLLQLFSALARLVRDTPPSHRDLTAHDTSKKTGWPTDTRHSPVTADCDRRPRRAARKVTTTRDESRDRQITHKSIKNTTARTRGQLTNSAEQRDNKRTDSRPRS